MDLQRGTSTVQFDEIGYWSEVKLDIVKEYAVAYSRILTAQRRLYHVYIDAFAGAGLHLSKTRGAFVPGSPVNALQGQPPFREYHFIDLKQAKVDFLRRLAGERSDVRIYQGDCNPVLLHQIFPHSTGFRNYLNQPIRSDDHSPVLCQPGG